MKEPGAEPIVSPEGDARNRHLQLADIIDVRAVQSLMDDFHALVSIPMAIVDLNGRVLVGVGWQEICTRFHRAQPESCRYCTESDTLLSAGVAPGHFKLYKCKNHMWDVATPILIGTEHVGNLFMGQFFFEGEAVDHELFRAQARRYGFPEPDYLAALAKVPRLSQQTMDRAMSYFSKLAQMLSQLSYSNLRLAQSLAAKAKAEEETRRNEARLASLLKLSQYRARSEQELLDVALNEAVALTGSQIGYIYRYDEARKLFTLNTWSKEVMQQCRIVEKQTVYELEKTGLWGEAVRQAAPIIVNDFAAPNPLKQGCPEGHAPLHRFLTVPVLVEGHVVGVVGVANKATDYDRSDVRQLTLLMDSVWKFVERKEAEAAIIRANEELQRSNRDLEQFAYVASHDLQEPLRAVGGYVKLLQRRFPESVDPKAREYIAGAAEGATRMERLITDLLAFSRVGTRGGAFVPSDLNELLGVALRNLQASVQAAHASVTHDSLPTLVVDPTQLMQLFQNLVGNAIKFQGEQPPRIHVGVRQEQHRWIISVRDNGIGIAPEYFERIFQIFQRLHTRKYYPGTGIGLAICKKIVERHGGTIWVESEAEKGCTFSFSLPKTAAPAAGAVS